MTGQLYISFVPILRKCREPGLLSVHLLSLALAQWIGQGSGLQFIGEVSLSQGLIDDLRFRFTGQHIVPLEPQVQGLVTDE